MAGDFEVLAAESTVELLGSTDVQDVYQVTARALPSGAVYHVRFPPAINDTESIRVILGEWATQYNALAALPGVVGVSTLQDVDASGQILDITEIVVSAPGGRITRTIEDRNFSYVSDAVKARVADTLAGLSALVSG